MPDFKVKAKKVQVKDVKTQVVDPETKDKYYVTERVGSLTVEFDADDLGGEDYKELVSMIGHQFSPSLSIGMRGLL